MHPPKKYKNNNKTAMSSELVSVTYIKAHIFILLEDTFPKLFLDQVN